MTQAGVNGLGQASPGRFQANIWKFYLFQFLLNLQLWWPIWVIYLQQERGLSLGQITLLDIPFWLSIVLLQVPAAAIADRWGRKRTLALGALSMGIAVTIFGLATSFWLLLASYLIWGVSFSLLTGPDSAFLFDSLRALGREGEYQRLYGRAWAVIMAAMLAGTLAGAPVAAATNLWFPIVLSGGIAFLAFLSAFTFAEPLPEFRSEMSLSYRGVMRDSLLLTFRRPTVRYAILFFGVMTVGTIGPIFFFQPFLVTHGVSLAQVGFWQMPMRIAGILGALIAYQVTRRLGERQTFLLMPAVIVASHALLAAWDSIYAQVGFPAINLMFIMSRPLLSDYLNRRVGSGQRATVISLTNLVYSLVLVPVAPALGILADKASLSASFWLGGAILALGAVAVLTLWSRAERKERAALPVEAEVAAD